MKIYKLIKLSIILEACMLLRFYNRDKYNRTRIQVSGPIKIAIYVLLFVYLLSFALFITIHFFSVRCCFYETGQGNFLFI
jgi:hypothetical protein